MVARESVQTFCKSRILLQFNYATTQNATRRKGRVGERSPGVVALTRERGLKQGRYSSIYTLLKLIALIELAQLNAVKLLIPFNIP